jgi:hypothetical protein
LSVILRGAEPIWTYRIAHDMWVILGVVSSPTFLSGF